MNCRFCGSDYLRLALDMSVMPLAGAFSKEVSKFYPLKLLQCVECGLVQVEEVPKEQTELFKKTLFRSGTSQEVQAHFKRLAAEIYARWGQHVVLEIGSNDGTLIKALRDYGVPAIGVDPAVNVYFTEEYAAQSKLVAGQVSIIVASYVFTHVDDPQDMMRGIDLLLKDDGILIIESYSLDNLTHKNQFDMVYHEHVIYLSLKPLVLFLDKFGMEIFEVKYLPFRSGCTRYYIRRKKDWKEVNKEIERVRNDLVSLFYKLKAEGKSIVGYGATGRATTMINHCGLEKFLDYVVDDTPQKQGLYMPGTNLEIKAWQDGADYVLIFAWAFADEIMARHKEYKGKWIVPLPEVRIL